MNEYLPEGRLLNTPGKPGDAGVAHRTAQGDGGRLCAGGEWRCGVTRSTTCT